MISVLPWVSWQTETLVWLDNHGDQCNQMPLQNQGGETVPAHTAQALGERRKRLCRESSVVLEGRGLA